MKMTKEQRKEEQDRIDATVKAVAILLPKGWVARECIALSLMGRPSPSIVMVRRDSDAHNQAMRAAPVEQQKEIRRKYYQQGAADAMVIKQVLNSNGFDSYRNGTAIYVRIKS